MKTVEVYPNHSCRISLHNLQKEQGLSYLSEKNLKIFNDALCEARKKVAGLNSMNYERLEVSDLSPELQYILSKDWLQEYIESITKQYDYNERDIHNQLCGLFTYELDYERIKQDKEGKYASINEREIFIKIVINGCFQRDTSTLIFNKLMTLLKQTEEYKKFNEISYKECDYSRTEEIRIFMKVKQKQQTKEKQKTLFDIFIGMFSL